MRPVVIRQECFGRTATPQAASPRGGAADAPFARGAGRAGEPAEPRPWLVGLELTPFGRELVVRLVAALDGRKAAIVRAHVTEVVRHDDQSGVDVPLSHEVVLAGIEGDGAAVQL